MPAERPIIRDLTGGQRQLGRPGVVGPHNEGARVVLECETSGGFPEPSLSWWRDGQLVDDSYEIVSAVDGQLLEQRRAAVDFREGELDEEENRMRPPGEGPDGQPTESQQEPHLKGPHTRTQARTQSQTQTQTQTLTLSRPPDQEGKPKQASGSSRLIRNRLELISLSRADLLANYSCRAANSRLGEPPSSSIMIDMNRK